MNPEKKRFIRTGWEKNIMSMLDHRSRQTALISTLPVGLGGGKRDIALPTTRLSHQTPVLSLPVLQ